MPGTTFSFTVLEQIEERYRLPTGYFRGKLPESGTGWSCSATTSVIRPSADSRANSIGSAGPSACHALHTGSSPASQISEPQQRQTIVTLPLPFLEPPCRGHSTLEKPAPGFQRRLTPGPPGPPRPSRPPSRPNRVTSASPSEANAERMKAVQDEAPSRYRLVWSGRRPEAGTPSLGYWVIPENAEAVKDYLDEQALSGDAPVVVEIEDGTDHFARRRSTTTAEAVRRWNSARTPLPEGRRSMCTTPP